MTVELLKKGFPFLIAGLLFGGGYFIKTEYPHWLPLGFGGQKFSPLETNARQYAQTAGRAIFNHCGNSRAKPNIRFLGFREQKNGKLRIHLEVTWEGMLNDYAIKGWVICDKDGTEATWEREKINGIVMPDCDDRIPSSLE